MDGEENAHGPRLPSRASIVSGYFGPLHDGHLDLFEAARDRAGYLIVIVNNDVQQAMKKGRVIQAATARLRIILALRLVDRAYMAIEQGRALDGTFDLIRGDYPDTDLEFCNGGDDRSNVADLPVEEVAAAARNGIVLTYGVGGDRKADSSTRLIAEVERSRRESG